MANSIKIEFFHFQQRVQRPSSSSSSWAAVGSIVPRTKATAGGSKHISLRISVCLCVCIVIAKADLAEMHCYCSVAVQSGAVI